MSYNYKIITLNGIKGKFVLESCEHKQTQFWNVSVFSNNDAKPNSSSFVRTFIWLKNNYPEEIL